MLKALIVEDEIPAQRILQKALQDNFDDIDIVGRTQSITSTVEWLSNDANHADIIFMDVELSDGKCFEIFNLTDVTAKVIIITAYDEYAIKAFKVNSIDYLLKPIDKNELVAAVEKCRKSLNQSQNQNTIGTENELLSKILGKHKEYKKRFVVKRGDKIIVVSATDIAYIFSEDKATYIVTTEGDRYIIEPSLDAIMPQLDPERFFRISRAYIVTLGSIKSVSKHLNSRLKVVLEPKVNDEVFVSRNRIHNFVSWLEGE